MFYYFHCKLKAATSRITDSFVQMRRFLPVAIVNFLLLFFQFLSATHFYLWCVHFSGIGNNFNRWLSVSKRETAIHAKNKCISVYVGQQNFYFYRIEITIIYTNRNVLQLFSISLFLPVLWEGTLYSVVCIIGVCDLFAAFKETSVFSW